MKPSELKTIYAEACRTATNRPVPDDAQEKIWRQLMGGFDAADLRAGLATWWQTEKFLPMPAELKPLAERARRDRFSKSALVKFLVAWSCPVCAASQSGYLSVEDRGVRHCSSPYGPVVPVDAPAGTRRTMLGAGDRCGAEMRIVLDERKAA